MRYRLDHRGSCTGLLPGVPKIGAHANGTIGAAARRFPEYLHFLVASQLGGRHATLRVRLARED